MLYPLGLKYLVVLALVYTLLSVNNFIFPLELNCKQYRITCDTRDTKNSLEKFDFKRLNVFTVKCVHSVHEIIKLKTQKR